MLSRIEPTTTSLSVSRAQKNAHDYQALVAVLESVRSEAVMPFNPHKAYREAWRLVDEGIVLLAWENGTPVGSMGLAWRSLWYSTQMMLMDWWTVVHPDYRGGEIFRALVGTAKKVADRKKVPLIIGVSSLHRTEAKCRLYRRMGFRPVITDFVYGGRHG